MKEKFVPPAPLFRDPVYDGAADPAVIYNEELKEWWIFYTGRRASAPNFGVSFMHGTDIGIAVSRDGGREWDYLGTACGLEFEEGRNTFWAPEIIRAGGEYHMYCSYVRGIPQNWNRERQIVHYTSGDLLHWEFQGAVPLSSDRVIDACVFETAPGHWKMWYKDERDNSHTWAAESSDLYQWTVLGPEITDCAHEGPNVFYFNGYYWMITDPWEGLAVYRSLDAQNWERKKNILVKPGIRRDDGFMAGHGDVLVCRDKAYIFYFVHPEMSMDIWKKEDRELTYQQRRSSLQAAELLYDGDTLSCDRDSDFYFILAE